MPRNRRMPRIAASSLSVVLILLVAACGGGSTSNGSGASEDEGTPVAGGSARILQSGEPRSLDPAALTNTWSHQPVLGNALYGALMVNNGESLAIEYKMATDFSSSDGGVTFNLALRPGLTFTDNTPLDAAAVKFNWDRLKDPALGSTSIRQATQVASTEVVDPQNLKVTMATANPHFAQSLLSGSMNWIASPTALAKGTKAFDENPVGAGPFVLSNWARQDAIELTKNPGFWDAPKPYLDQITITTVPDSNQRINVMTTGGADLASETNWANIHKAEKAGLTGQVVATSGGQIVGMNFRRAPFNDIRAREAVALAVDRDALNTVVYNSEAEVPATLLAKESPFFSDVQIRSADKARAQELFDELAAEGKPVSFTFLSYPTTESKAVAEGVQTQLSAFDNVDVEVEVVDYAAATARAGQRDFDMTITASLFEDPDAGLWPSFHSTSSGNFLGVDDPELDQALDLGRTASTQEERTQAYETVQKRLAEIHPGVWYVRALPSVIYGENVHGVDLYTLGSPLPEDIWLN